MAINFYSYLKIVPYARWNFSILKLLAENEGIDFNDTLINYLKETPWNTNLQILSEISGGSEEKWPKEIVVVRGDSGWELSEDSDFSSFKEAFDFIQENWGDKNEVSTDYIVLNYAPNSEGHIHTSYIQWFDSDMVYTITENGFNARDDS